MPKPSVEGSPGWKPSFQQNLPLLPSAEPLTLSRLISITVSKATLSDLLPLHIVRLFLLLGMLPFKSLSSKGLVPNDVIVSVNVESLCYVPSTNIILYANYTFKKVKNEGLVSIPPTQ